MATAIKKATSVSNVVIDHVKANKDFFEPMKLPQMDGVDMVIFGGIRGRKRQSKKEISCK